VAKAKKTVKKVQKTTSNKRRNNALILKKPRIAKSATKTATNVKTNSKLIKKRSTNSKAVLEKKIKGYASDAAGLRFEQDVIAYYAKHGWLCKPRVKKFGREYDIVGTKEDYVDEEILVVECKNKQRVTAGDVLSFIAKANKFNNAMDTEIQAIIAYTGELPRDAQQAAKSAKTRIKFKRF
jgi:hypothetical protein